MDTTEDRILNGQVILHQPRDGYRAAVDPVLLAACVPAKAGERALDLGCGVGAAMLCLAKRIEGVEIDGLELQPELAALARRNVAENGLDGHVRVFAGDLLDPPTEIQPDGYNHVFANPPYMDDGRGHPPPNASKRTAHVEGAAELADWVRATLKFCKTKGTVTFIQRADRLAPLLATLDGPAGEIVVYPLWPQAEEAAKRVIVRARKGLKSPLKVSAGLVLHDAGGYSATVAQVLGGAPLDITV